MVQASYFYFQRSFIEKGKECGEGGELNPTAFETKGPVFYKASSSLQDTSKTSNRDHLCHTLRQIPWKKIKR